MPLCFSPAHTHNPDKNTQEDMLVSSETLFGILTTSILGFLFNLYAASLTKQQTNVKHPLLLKFTGTNAPVYTWLLSAVLSGSIYPTLYVLAMYYTGSAGRAEWLYGTDGRPLSEPGQDLQCMKYIFYIFFGYLVRDLPKCIDNPLFVAHHCACMAGIVSTLETTSPGAVSGTHGIIFLELGSFYFNVWSVDDVMRHHPQHFPWWPQWQGPWIAWGYYSMLSLSNFISGYFLYNSAVASFQHGYTGFGSWSLVSGTPLLILRQYEVYKAMRGINKKPTMLKEDLDALK